MRSSRRSRLLLGLLAALAGTDPARAEPPPYSAELSRWAQQNDYLLSDFRNCSGIEEKSFGAMGSVCWTAKRRTPQPGTRLYPRLSLTLVVYRDGEQAHARLARFREIPAQVTGEARKTYPLGAAFQKDTYVLLVATDAGVFIDDVEAAAQALAQQLHGKDVTLWRAPPASK